MEACDIGGLLSAIIRVYFPATFEVLTVGSIKYSALAV